MSQPRRRRLRDVPPRSRTRGTLVELGRRVRSASRALSDAAHDHSSDSSAAGWRASGPRPATRRGVRTRRRIRCVARGRAGGHDTERLRLDSAESTRSSSRSIGRRTRLSRVTRISASTFEAERQSVADPEQRRRVDQHEIRPLASSASESRDAPSR